MNSLLQITILSLLSSSLIAQTDQSLFGRFTRHSEWSYEGESGPSHWSELDEQYERCSQGKQQSPIDIDVDHLVSKLSHLDLYYHSFYVDLINNGHTLIEQVVEPRALVLDEVPYTLLQFHFHTPSEHHVNGKEYPMEIHFVHISKESEYAVMAIFLQESSEENQFLKHFIGHLPTHINEEIAFNDKADPIETIPVDHSFYYYEGSLTTPPCTEGVHWILMEQPVSATRDQIEAIHQIIKDDNRPIQPRRNRTIYFSSNN